jgi:lysophospholipase L1-like esterase
MSADGATRREAVTLAGAALALPAAARGLPGGATVLFQGDSITDGGRLRVGTDLNHTMGQDYAYIISARLGAEQPERQLSFVNRGVSGDTIADLTARWDADTLALKPALLSILVGVNDAVSTTKPVPLADYARLYRALLMRTRAALPGVRLALGEPFLLPVGRYRDSYAQRMVDMRQRQAIVATLAAESGATLVRYAAAFERAQTRAPADYWCWDGVHPTYAGHGLMAAEWLRAIGSL